MTQHFASSKLTKARSRVVTKVRELRLARQWTQAELGLHLGLSQARLSEIERGQGSFTAEQLLAVLELFNVDISEFLPPVVHDGELQNALIQHGARHLRQVPRAASPGRVRTPGDLIVALLLHPSSTRFVTALGLVVVHNMDEISLPTLRTQLTAAGRQARLGWLLDNLRTVLPICTPEDVGTKRKLNRTITLLNNELMHFPLPNVGSPPDIFDLSIRSQSSLELVWDRQASELSRRWGIATEIQPVDFLTAFEEANEPD